MGRVVVIFVRIAHILFITCTRFRKRSWLRDQCAPAYAVEQGNGFQPTPFPTLDRYHEGAGCAEFKCANVSTFESGRDCR